MGALGAIAPPMILFSSTALPKSGKPSVNDFVHCSESIEENWKRQRAMHKLRVTSRIYSAVKVNTI